MNGLSALKVSLSKSSAEQPVTVPLSDERRVEVWIPPGRSPDITANVPVTEDGVSLYVRRSDRTIVMIRAHWSDSAAVLHAAIARAATM